MFSGLRSDSIALSHVWLGLPGGRFQSDEGLRIAAATARRWSLSGALHCALLYDWFSTEAFRITHNVYDTAVSPDLSFSERANTRGNNYKLQNHCFHYDLRKHFFLSNNCKYLVGLQLA